MNQQLSDPPRFAERYHWFPTAGREAVREAVERGAVALAFPYGGVPAVWRGEYGYRFTLYQYGARTRNELFAGLDDAVEAFFEAEATL